MRLCLLSRMCSNRSTLECGACVGIVVVIAVGVLERG